VNAGRALAAPLALIVAAGLGACQSTPPTPTPPYTVPPESVTPPPISGTVPDAIPRLEPRARSGNPPFYSVFGRRYYVLSSSVGYRERGVASWYGPGFHKVRTSTGERYDMYAMTAAHKTLPLPAYVRVTNLQNGRSVVVRVNDRGPFVGNRIIDLSYSAAAKLGMLRNGTAMVDVRTIDPSEPPPVITASNRAQAPATAAPGTAVAAAAAPTAVAPSAVVSAAAGPNAAAASAAVSSTSPADSSPAAAGSALFVQAGAFSDPANAERLAQNLRGRSYGKVFVRDDQIAGRRMYRVRIGPVADVAEFDRIVAALERAGINDAHLALD
jgi:peptidoglycan lytic transglycosylase